jgi:hypothetical protein
MSAWPRPLLARLCATPRAGSCTSSTCVACCICVVLSAHRLQHTNCIQSCRPALPERRTVIHLRCWPMLPVPVHAARLTLTRCSSSQPRACLPARRRRSLPRWQTCGGAPSSHCWQTRWWRTWSPSRASEWAWQLGAASWQLGGNAVPVPAASTCTCRDGHVPAGNCHMAAWLCGHVPATLGPLMHMAQCCAYRQGYAHVTTDCLTPSPAACPPGTS